MNNYIALYGEPLEYPHQVSVDKHGTAYYGFDMATERVSGIKDITQVIVEEGTPAFESLIAIDKVKDLLGLKLLVTGRIRTRNLQKKEHSKLYISVRAQEITETEYKGETNGVIMTGHICKIGKMRTTPRGIRITDLIIACGREDGSSVSDYIPAVAWNGTAVRAQENLKVGSCIAVKGRLQSREYEKESNSGEREARTCYELSIERYEEIPEEEKKEA